MNYLTCYLFLLLSLVFAHTGKAQKGDTSVYYQSYNHQITGRTFLSRKFTNLRLSGDNYSLSYKPRTSSNLGAGFTYRWVTFNFGYGFDFLNPNLNRDKTRNIDLQFHPYGKKIAMDVIGQFYKGFDLSAPPGPLRTDIRVNAVGATVQYIFNHSRFSYRAAFLQSEWQKLSAGSWLVGFETYTGLVKADSSMVPNEKKKENKLKSVRFFEIGPNVGYAYTYVYQKHFFVTSSVSVSLDLGFNKSVTEAGVSRASGFSPNTLFKFFAGYNSSVWAASVIYISNAVRVAATTEDKRITLNTGNFRVHFAYRFKPGKKTRRFLKPLDRINNEL